MSEQLPAQEAARRRDYQARAMSLLTPAQRAALEQLCETLAKDEITARNEDDYDCVPFDVPLSYTVAELHDLVSGLRALGIGRDEGDET